MELLSQRAACGGTNELIKTFPPVRPLAKADAGLRLHAGATEGRTIEDVSKLDLECPTLSV